LADEIVDGSEPVAFIAATIVVVAATDGPGPLERALADGTFVITVEMEPPRSFNAQRLAAAAQTLADAGGRWASEVIDARQRLLLQEDLPTQLLKLVDENR
jgi:hypothetical protein